MRFVHALALVTGCGFQGPLTTFASGDDGGVDAPQDPSPDAAQVGDAAIDALVIVPVDAALHDAFVSPDANPWPCGTEPAAPTASVTFGTNTTGMTASQISLDGVQRLVVTPGESLSLAFRYVLHDSACDACVDQIEYGFVQGSTGKRIDCAFDRQLQDQAATGTVPTQVFNAPLIAGRYDLRLAQAENFSCRYQGAMNWYAGNPPPANQTIAIICVH